MSIFILLLTDRGGGTPKIKNKKNPKIPESVKTVVLIHCQYSFKSYFATIIFNEANIVCSDLENVIYKSYTGTTDCKSVAL